MDVTSHQNSETALVAQNARKFKGGAMLPPYNDGVLKLKARQLSFTTPEGEELFRYGPQDTVFVVPTAVALVIKPKGQRNNFCVAYDSRDALQWELFAGTASQVDIAVYNPKKQWQETLNEAGFRTKYTGFVSSVNPKVLLYFIIVTLFFGLILAGQIIAAMR